MIFNALGHPDRVAIIEYLLQVNSSICNDWVNELPLSQPTISQHSKELINAGLIKGNIEGNSLCYCIDFNTIQKLQTFLIKINYPSQNQNFDCC
jgi:DNA-binding transcriptional ArsR family regulator